MLYFSPNDLSWPDWKLPEANRTDYATALSQPFSVAVLMAGCTDPGYPWYDPALRDLDFSKFDLVLLSDVEFYKISDLKLWAENNNIKNYKLLIGGYEYGSVLEDNMLYRPWWAFNIVNSNPAPTFTIVEKPYLFDVLLGQRRYSRDFVMHSMQHHNLLDQNIVTYRDVFGNYGSENEWAEQQVTNHFRHQKLLWPYISNNLLPEWEVRSKITRDVSAIMPTKIYENTYYSIIAEAAINPNTFFLSEKAGKVFYGHRPFIHFGTSNYMAELHKLGFATFSDVIDENYDSERDLIKRFTLAFDQVVELSKQNPIKVLNKLKPVLEHNHNRLREWLVESREQIIQLRDRTVKLPC